MTKRDFELIAQAVNDAYRGSLDDRSAQGACIACAIHLADALWRTNERFNRDRFLRACGVES